MTETSWAKSATGIYVPPEDATKHVEKAMFAVKIIGFVSEKRLQIPDIKKPPSTEGGQRSRAGTAKPGEPG